MQSLEHDIRKKHAPRRSHFGTRQLYGKAKLERIVGPYFRVTLPATKKQGDSGRKVGTVEIQQCYVYKKHLKRDASVNHAQTYFCCSIF